MDLSLWSKSRHFVWHLNQGLATLYVGAVASLAGYTGIALLLFPELGALTYDVLTRPQGSWARSPRMLIITPTLNALLGILLTSFIHYSLFSVLLMIGIGLVVIHALKSPIVPAISAGLLPLTLGIRSWLYPAAILVTLLVLVLLAQGQKRMEPEPVEVRTNPEDGDDLLESLPTDFSWAGYFGAFILIAATLAVVTGWRFILYPPLVVIAYEMFAHAKHCPWVNRPVMLPLACTSHAAAGVMLVMMMGVGPLAAMASMVVGMLILRVVRLNIPPVLAVGLLPFAVNHPDIRLPVAVGIGTTLLTLIFLLWQSSPVTLQRLRA
ncbi:MAG: HPP family protein [Pseudomonadales bacterium]|nr:HPP family protein [Pseudomonadales bacterium]